MEGTNKVDDGAGINELPNDAIVEILSRQSHMNRREAVRTSILPRKWRCLPSLCPSPVTLVLDSMDLVPTGCVSMREQFIEWVDRVLKLHQDTSLNGLIIRSPVLGSRYVSHYEGSPGDADAWIYFSILKQVKMFELEYNEQHYQTNYEFPNADMLSSHLRDLNTFGFVSLSFLNVNIGDEVVHYFLAMCQCPYLERLCIRNSDRIENLKVVDPLPNGFGDIQLSLHQEISVTSHVKCNYEGGVIIFPFKKNPNLSELTLGGNIARSFIYNPKKHTSYSEYWWQYSPIPYFGYYCYLNFEM